MKNVGKLTVPINFDTIIKIYIRRRQGSEMAFYYKEDSRTFSEYLLVPNLTRKDCIPSQLK